MNGNLIYAGTLLLVMSTAACSPYPEIGHRAQAQVHCNGTICMTTDGNIAQAPHTGGAMPGQVWVVDPLKVPAKPSGGGL